MQGEKEFLRRVAVVRFLVKKFKSDLLYNKFYTSVVRNLVFETNVVVEWRQLFRDQVIVTS